MRIRAIIVLLATIAAVGGITEAAAETAAATVTAASTTASATVAVSPAGPDDTPWG